MDCNVGNSSNITSIGKYAMTYNQAINILALDLMQEIKENLPSLRSQVDYDALSDTWVDGILIDVKIAVNRELNKHNIVTIQ